MPPMPALSLVKHAALQRTTDERLLHDGRRILLLRWHGVRGRLMLVLTEERVQILVSLAFARQFTLE